MRRRDYDGCGPGLKPRRPMRIDEGFIAIYASQYAEAFGVEPGAVVIARRADGDKVIGVTFSAPGAPEEHVGW